MPRSEDVLSIFLASPGDVADERVRMIEVIEHWNQSWSRNLGLRLELLRWEDDAYPDIGDDAQEVINHQIPTDWDIFVGIMWSRFGTPTGRSGSGTQEEFERALAKHRLTPGSISVLFYFKDSPIAPSKVDTVQLHQVQNFRKSLQSVGLLTWDFADTDQFEKLIGLHITKHVQAWRRTKVYPVDSLPEVVAEAAPCTDVATAPPAGATAEGHEDEGYLDLLEAFSEHSSEMGEIAVRLTAAQQELTEKTNKGREELEQMREEPSASAKRIRASIARVAEQMLKFTAHVEHEAPLFRVALDASMSTLTRLATLSAEMYPEQLETTKVAGLELLQTLIAARQSTQGFRDSTSGLPRMTKELNVAKRRQVAALERLVSEFENGERLLAEGLAVISGLSGRNLAS